MEPSPDPQQCVDILANAEYVNHVCSKTFNIEKAYAGKTRDRGKEVYHCRECGLIWDRGSRSAAKGTR